MLWNSSPRAVFLLRTPTFPLIRLFIAFAIKCGSKTIKTAHLQRRRHRARSLYSTGGRTERQETAPSSLDGGAWLEERASQTDRCSSKSGLISRRGRKGCGVAKASRAASPLPHSSSRICTQCAFEKTPLQRLTKGWASSSRAMDLQLGCCGVRNTVAANSTRAYAAGQDNVVYRHIRVNIKTKKKTRFW